MSCQSLPPVSRITAALPTEEAFKNPECFLAKGQTLISHASEFSSLREEGLMLAGYRSPGFLPPWLAPLGTKTNKYKENSPGLANVGGAAGLQRDMKRAPRRHLCCPDVGNRKRI